MTSVVIPDSDGRRLPFFLAAEEWVARCLPAGDYFFAWRVEPTVICGRHQEIDKEVDLDYCLKNGIDVVRRRSGGGCVFADRNNWMFSYITPGDSVDTTFSRYTSMMASTLRALGFDAEPTGRNDILVGGAKVAGNAFYHLPGRCIVHGTMLLDIDFEHMSRAITPSRAKLESKGVHSVASRVTSLRAAGLTMGVEEFGKYVTDSLCRDSITLSPENIAEIEALEQRYYEHDFLKIAPTSAYDTHTRHRRIEGVGSLYADVRTDAQGNLADVNITGDFFADHDALEAWKLAVRGVPMDHESLRQRILGLDSPIAGMQPAELAELLTD